MQQHASSVATGEDRAPTQSGRPARAGVGRRLRIQRWQLMISGGIALAFLLWGLIVASTVTTYDATVLFTESRSIGLPPPVEYLDFGDVPTGLPMHRKLTLANEGKVNTYMLIISRGGIRDFLSISDAFFNLAPGETKDVELTALAPVNIQDGRHNGKVYVIRLPWIKLW